MRNQKLTNQRQKNIKHFFQKQNVKLLLLQNILTVTSLKLGISRSIPTVINSKTKSHVPKSFCKIASDVAVGSPSAALSENYNRHSLPLTLYTLLASKTDFLEAICST